MQHTLVLEAAERTLEGDLGTNGKVLQVVAHLTLGVDLDNQVQVALGVFISSGSVLACNKLLLLVGELDAEMLANGEIESRILGRKAETEEHGVATNLGWNHINLKVEGGKNT